MSAHPGQKALEALDTVLSKRPKPDGDAFSQATMCLAQFRDEMIAGGHDGQSVAGRERLARLNSVISVVLGGHFPLGNVPWDEIEKAREWLQQLLDDAKAGAEH
jgi:hypothetical protein